MSLYASTPGSCACHCCYAAACVSHCQWRLYSTFVLKQSTNLCHHRLHRCLSVINHEPTFLEVACERAALAQLLLPPDMHGAEQQLPPFAIAARATFDAVLGVMALDALVASYDGRIMHRLKHTATVGCVQEAEALGADVGQQLQQAAQQSGLCNF